MNQELLTLSVSDSKAQRALLTGWSGHPGDPSSKRLIARKWIPAEGSAGHVIFETIASKRQSTKTMGAWIQATRAFSLTATATPCIAVTLWLLLGTAPLSWGVASLALIAVICLQIAINIFNDLEDYRRLIDLPDTLGGSGVIQQGLWSPLQLRAIARGVFALGILGGLPAIIAHPEALVPIAVVAGAGVLGYSAQRWGFKYNALGDLAVALLCGPALTAGFAISLSGHADPGSLWIGVFFGSLAIVILHVNNLQDLNVDRARGIRTLAGLLGFNRSRMLPWILHGGATLALLGGIAFDHLPPELVLAVSVQWAVALPHLKKVSQASGPDSALLSNCRVYAAKIHLLSGLSVCLMLGVAALRTRMLG